MTDVVVAGENLVSTTRAAELSGYSKDYIGQLCRAEKISCRRISGQWYVDIRTLQAYQKKEGNTEAEKPAYKKAVTAGSVTTMKVGNVRDDTFTYDGVEYVSTNRAADVTGYAQDYIGQLARGKEVAARKVGRRWFVSKEALLKHKKHHDAQLAAVQAQSAGLSRSDEEAEDVAAEEGSAVPVKKETIPTEKRPKLNFNVRYVTETHEALPIVRTSDAQGEEMVTQADPAVVPEIEDAESAEPENTHTLDVLQHAAPTAPVQRTSSRGSRQDDIRSSRRHATPTAQSFSVSTRGSHSNWLSALIWTFLAVLLVAAALWFGYQFWSAGGDLGILGDIQSELQNRYGEIVPGKDVNYTSE